MKPFQLAIVFCLGAVIAGSAVFFANKVVYPYRHLRGHAVPKYVHPLAAKINEAEKLQAQNHLPEAQKLLRDQIHLYPNAPQVQRARDLLGEINTRMFFANDNLYAKTQYVVKRGDSLWRIARKLDSTPDIIKRANNLETNLIRPGEQLLIPENDFTLTLDLPHERAVVHQGDAFFKQYPIVEINLPPSKQTQVMTKVTATTFWKDGAMVSSEPKEEDPSIDPRIHLKQRGYILYGVADDSAISDDAVELSEKAKDSNKIANSPPHGIALMEDDLSEMRLLIRRGTPVTIIRAKE